MNQRYVAIFVDEAARDSFAEALVQPTGIVDAKVIKLTSLGVVFEAPIHEEAALFAWLDRNEQCRSYTKERTYNLS